MLRWMYRIDSGDFHYYIERSNGILLVAAVQDTLSLFFIITVWSSATSRLRYKQVLIVFNDISAIFLKILNVMRLEVLVIETRL